jgi:hypothetical protein
MVAYFASPLSSACLLSLLKALISKSDAVIIGMLMMK